MKLKYQIAETTNLDPQMLIDGICAMLEKRKYRVINKNGYTVRFDDYALWFKWRNVSRVDGGVFEVRISENGSTISLVYYLNLIVELILIPITLLYSALVNYVAFFMPIVISLMFLSRIISVKQLAKEMINDVTHFEGHP